MNLTLEETLDRAWKFIQANRIVGKECFLNGTEEQVKNAIREAAFKKCCLICYDLEENVIGIVYGKNDDETETFHVLNILTTHPDAIKTFVRVFDYLWPGYSLSGTRYGKLKNYNTPRFKALMK